ncbi:MAG: DNA-directed RNA polymerase subunit omega [Candidatus Omnitrophica bacterium]|nr:DNA-directed RNA polymerase subunit omega [Candidatus Omnitrophota bacterium]
MAQQPIEELLPKSGYSVYQLVRMASMRALELADGKPHLIKSPSTDKLTSIALEEIYQGKIETVGAAAVREEMKKSKNKN